MGKTNFGTTYDGCMSKFLTGRSLNDVFLVSGVIKAIAQETTS